MIRFKERYVASDFHATLTGSYESDELDYPGFHDEIELLMLIDAYGEQHVEATLKTVNGPG